MIRTICTIVAISTGLILACVTTQETGRKQFIMVSDGQMNAMGVQAYQEVLEKEKLSTDQKMTEVLRKVGKRIADASGKNFQWEFNLIESKTVNAFCLPGGKVAFYTGILPIAKTEAGMAAIMGHEVAHAVLRHGSERVSQAVAAQAGLSIAALSFGDSKYRDLIVGSIGIGTQFGVLLPFSRKHESEADIVGLKYMAIAGYEPKEAVTLWQRMAKEGGRAPEVLSTHPDPERRSRDLEGEIKDVQEFYNKSEKQPSRELVNQESGTHTLSPSVPSVIR